MKYCQHCGKEVRDEAVICPNCGCRCQEEKKQEESSGLAVAALVFGILGGWLGIVLGAIGLKKYGEGTNRNMCIAGIALSVIWILIAIVIAIVV